LILKTENIVQVSFWEKHETSSIDPPEAQDIGRSH
jgi:hypothetical protein